MAKSSRFNSVLPNSDKLTSHGKMLFDIGMLQVVCGCNACTFHHRFPPVLREWWGDFGWPDWRVRSFSQALRKHRPPALNATESNSSVESNYRKNEQKLVVFVVSHFFQNHFRTHTHAKTRVAPNSRSNWHALARLQTLTNHSKNSILKNPHILVLSFTLAALVKCLHMQMSF